MAIIQTEGGNDVSFNTMLDLKSGWCPFCDPQYSDIKVIHSTTKRPTWYCKNCDEYFIYTGQD